MKTYVVDFETTTDKDDCRIYAIGMVDIDNPVKSFKWCTDLDSFFFNIVNENCKLYFHNLSFDGSFIIDWLFKNGFKWYKELEQYDYGCFSTLIGEMGEFYSITIRLPVDNDKLIEITILDSLKLIPMPLKDIPKAYGLNNIKKLDENYDYNKIRPEGYILSEDEEEYLLNDCVIVALALKIMFKQKMDKLTIAGNAMSQYKKIMGKKFNKLFPFLDYDGEIRNAYKGGFTYLNPYYKNKDVYNEIVLDVNSLYPSRMYYDKLPYGEGIKYNGKYIQDNFYPLYIQKIKCQFHIKENKIPTIQIKNSRYCPTEYLYESDGITELTLCNVDLEMFLEQYYVEGIEYIEGYKYQSSINLFTKYIEKWIKIKETATLNGNKGERQISKLMLNSLYGKFASNPLSAYKQPHFNYKTNIIEFETIGEIREPIYLPIAIFITAYARRITISTSQQITDYSIEKYGVDKYIYSDTDSIHTLLTIEELETFCDISPTRLGAWDNEGMFKRARYIRAKTYIQEDFNGNTLVTCAGLPENTHSQVNFDNFRPGKVYTGKLQSRKVKGGVILESTTFKIS